MLELLERLCAAAAPSGSEGACAQIILKEIEGHCETSTDALGNIIAYKKGRERAKRKVMLSAHMDEVGVMVTNVLDDGTLRFAPLGGIDARVVAGRRVRFVKSGIPGVAGLKTLHLLEGDERNAPPSFDRMFLDIGAQTREEALSLVRPGDSAVFDSEWTLFGDGCLKARAIDDRAGCAMMIEMIRAEQPYDLVFTFVTQEELGCRGARPAAYTVAPDAAIVLEATTAADIAGVPEEKRVCRLGGGAVVSFMDRGTLYDPGLYALALETAKREGIPAQPKQAVAGGNDASAIHQSRGGVRTAALSVPCRYLHSPSCVIRLSDAEATLRLASSLAAAVAGGAAI